MSFTWSHIAITSRSAFFNASDAPMPGLDRREHIVSEIRKLKMFSTTFGLNMNMHFVFKRVGNTVSAECDIGTAKQKETNKKVSLEKLVTRDVHTFD